MAYLYRNRQAAFSTLKHTFDLTSGNTATHTSALEDAGYVEGGRVLVEGSVEKRYRITSEGSQAFRGYVDELEGLLEGIGALDDARVPGGDPAGSSDASNDETPEG